MKQQFCRSASVTIPVNGSGGFRQWPRRLCRTAALTAVLATLGACAAGPTLDGRNALRLEVAPSSDFTVRLDNQSDARPGELAAEGASQGLSECSDSDYPIASIIAAPLCAAIGAIGGATTGAIVTAVTTLPEDDADALIQASRQAIAVAAWADELQAELEAEAASRGKSVVQDHEAQLYDVFAKRIEWRISAGNRASLRGEFAIGTYVDGDYRFRDFSVSSRAHSIQHWTADNGHEIVAAYAELISAASIRAWEILDPASTRPRR